MIPHEKKIIVTNKTQLWESVYLPTIAELKKKKPLDRIVEEIASN